MITPFVAVKKAGDSRTIPEITQEAVQYRRTIDNMRQVEKQLYLGNMLYLSRHCPQCHGDLTDGHCTQCEQRGQ